MTAVATSPIRAFFANVRPRMVRTFREFAEQEIVLPDGPRAGLRFRCEYMPWTAAVLAEFSAGRYRRYIGSGPVQSGKTLLFFVLPILYHLFEIRENVIIGAPTEDIGKGMYEEKVLPVIQRSRYRNLLPLKGPGSRGGTPKTLVFANGSRIRFMAAGAGDAARSGFTARVVVETEIDKMDQPGAASREADPATQMEARNRAYGERARFYAECTMSTEKGRVHFEVVEVGTYTRVALRCPHCGVWVVPERGHFTGWEDAENVMAARENAGYACQECGALWTEAERIKALRHPVLVAEGETVNPDGTIQGEPRRTHTFGFVWNAMHSALLTMADIAEAEYRADNSDNPQDTKALLQFTWALPYKEELTDVSGITRDLVLAKIGRHAKGVVPDGCTQLTVFIDLGLHWCWWTAWAWREDARGYLIDYGAIEVPHRDKANPLEILASLRAFREDVLVPGWTCAGAPRRHDLLLVDSGYQADVAYTFVRESGNGYLASKGLGSARNQGAWRDMKPGKGRRVGAGWGIVRQPDGTRLVSMHADRWKRQLHQGFAAAAGAPGSLELFKREPREHLGFARQIIAEREEEEFVPGRGARRYWRQVSHANHYLDCSYGAMVAAAMLGINLVTGERVKQARPKGRDTGAKPRVRHIRSRY